MKHPEKDAESPKTPAVDPVSSRTWLAQSVTVRRSNRKFTPPTDVIEFPDRLVVLVEIAGMRAEDFQLTLFNNRLIVHGIRERPPFDNPAYHQVEIGFGEFRIEINLPWPILQDEVSAAYGEGFLQVDLPRRGSEQITVIDANAETQDS
jgi:HSP20 family protein